MIDKKYISASIMAYMAFFVFGALVCIVSANIFVLTNHFQADSAQINMMFSAMSFGRLISIFLSGVAADRFGRKKVVLVSMVCAGFFYGALPFTNNLTIAYLLIGFAGMGHGMTDSAATALLFDAFPNKTNFALGLLQTFFCFGAFAIPIVSGYFATVNISFAYLFWGLSLLCLVAFLGFAFSPFPPFVQHNDKQIEQMTFQKQPSVLKEGVLLGVSVFCYAAGSTIMLMWVAPYALSIVGMSEGSAVSMLSYFNLGCILGTLLFAKLLKRIHSSLFFVANPLSVVILLLVYSLMKSPPFSYPLFFFIGIFGGIYYSLALSLVGELFPNKRATASGSIMGMAALGTAVAPFVSGALFHRLGILQAFEAALWFLGFCALFGFFYFLRYRKIKNPLV